VKASKCLERFLRKTSMPSYGVTTRLLSVSVHRREKRLKLLPESGEIKTRSLCVTRRKRQIVPWCPNPSVGNLFCLFSGICNVRVYAGRRR
jgi:hypothetical protein